MSVRHSLLLCPKCPAIWLPFAISIKTIVKSKLCKYSQYLTTHNAWQLCNCPEFLEHSTFLTSSTSPIFLSSSLAHLFFSFHTTLQNLSNPIHLTTKYPIMLYQYISEPTTPPNIRHIFNITLFETITVD